MIEMKKVEKLKLTKKNGRWFTETNDRFDGTAQNYGYKTPRGLYRAYYYFLNKNKFAKQRQEIKHFLEINSDIKTVLDNYFDETNCFYRMKDREQTSIENLIKIILKTQPEVVKKLEQNKDIWKSLMRYYLI